MYKSVVNKISPLYLSCPCRVSKWFSCSVLRSKIRLWLCLWFFYGWPHSLQWIMCSRGWSLQSLLALSQPLSRLAPGRGYCHMLAGEEESELQIEINPNCRSPCMSVYVRGGSPYWGNTAEWPFLPLTFQWFCHFYRKAHHFDGTLQRQRLLLVWSESE